jgi:isocitrate/isopropylmalate dehydrogenase
LFGRSISLGLSEHRWSFSKARHLEGAIARVIVEGKARTYDMGGNATTLDIAKAIASYASS